MIIAFGHRRRMGKDTCAKFAETELRINTKNAAILRQGFAHKLYDICCQLYGWAGFQTYAYYDAHPDRKEDVLTLLGKTPRQILIEVGNKLREVYEQTWIDLLLARSIGQDYLLIPDIRYLNEVEAVRRNNGIIVKVVRPEIEIYRDMADNSLDEFNEWDFVINNDGSLNLLYERVQRLLCLVESTDERGQNLEIP